MRLVPFFRCPSCRTWTAMTEAVTKSLHTVKRAATLPSADAWIKDKKSQSWCQLLIVCSNGTFCLAAAASEDPKPQTNGNVLTTGWTGFLQFSGEQQWTNTAMNDGNTHSLQRWKQTLWAGVLHTLKHAVQHEADSVIGVQLHWGWSPSLGPGAPALFQVSPSGWGDPRTSDVGMKDSSSVQCSRRNQFLWLLVHGVDSVCCVSPMLFFFLGGTIGTSSLDALAVYRPHWDCCRCLRTLHIWLKACPQREQL